jgi:hypothetical protein
MAPASAPWQRSHQARLCRMTPSGASSEGEQPIRRESSLARRHCRDVAKVARSSHWGQTGPEEALLVKLRQSIAYAVEARFTRGMTSVSLASKRRM